MNCAVLDCYYPAIHRAWISLGGKRVEIGICEIHHRIVRDPSPSYST